MISLARVVKDDFAASRRVFETILRGMEDDEARSLTHSDLEEYLLEKGPELMRQLVQDYLDRRAGKNPGWTWSGTPREWNGAASRMDISGP